MKEGNTIAPYTFRRVSTTSLNMWRSHLLEQTDLEWINLWFIFFFSLLIGKSQVFIFVQFCSFKFCITPVRTGGLSPFHNDNFYSELSITKWKYIQQWISLLSLFFQGDYFVILLAVILMDNYLLSFLTASQSNYSHASWSTSYGESELTLC